MSVGDCIRIMHYIGFARRYSGGERVLKGLSNDVWNAVRSTPGNPYLLPDNAHCRELYKRGRPRLTMTRTSFAFWGSRDVTELSLAPNPSSCGTSLRLQSRPCLRIVYPNPTGWPLLGIVCTTCRCSKAHSMYSMEVFQNGLGRASSGSGDCWMMDRLSTGAGDREHAVSGNLLGLD